MGITDIHLVCFFLDTVSSHHTYYLTREVKAFLFSQLLMRFPQQEVDLKNDIRKVMFISADTTLTIGIET